MSEKKMLQGIASILEETLPEDWSKVVFTPSTPRVRSLLSITLLAAEKTTSLNALTKKAFRGHP